MKQRASEGLSWLRQSLPAYLWVGRRQEEVGQRAGRGRLPAGGLVRRLAGVVVRPVGRAGVGVVLPASLPPLTVALACAAGLLGIALGSGGGGRGRDEGPKRLKGLQLGRGRRSRRRLLQRLGLCQGEAGGQGPAEHVGLAAENAAAEGCDSQACWQQRP